VRSAASISRTANRLRDHVSVSYNATECELSQSCLIFMSSLLSVLLISYNFLISCVHVVLFQTHVGLLLLPGTARVIKLSTHQLRWMNLLL